MLVDVIEFCSRNNIALPSHQEDKSNIDSAPLHSIIDKVEEENFLLWKNICKQIRSGILILMKTGSPNFSKSSGRNFDYQIFLFELLQIIFPFNTVFEDYCQVQVNFLNQENLNSLSSDLTKKDTKNTILDLERVVTKVLKIIVDNNRLLSHFTNGIQKELLLAKLLELYKEAVDLQTNNFLDFHNKTSYSHINLDKTFNSSDVSTFSVHNVKSFSKVFWILSNWSQEMEYFLKNISNQFDNTKKDHVMNESSQCLLLHVRSWGKLFTPYQPLLQKVIPVYVQSTFDSIINGDASSSLISLDKNDLHFKSVPLKITSVSIFPFR